MDKEEVQKLADTIGEKVKSGISDCTNAIEALQEEQRKQAEDIKPLQSKNVVSVPGIAEEKANGKEFSFCKAASAIATGNLDDAGYEKEVLDSAKSKHFLKEQMLMAVTLYQKNMLLTLLN